MEQTHLWGKYRSSPLLTNPITVVLVKGSRILSCQQSLQGPVFHHCPFVFTAAVKAVLVQCNLTPVLLSKLSRDFSSHSEQKSKLAAGWACLLDTLWLFSSYSPSPSLCFRYADLCMRRHVPSKDHHCTWSFFFLECSSSRFSHGLFFRSIGFFLTFSLRLFLNFQSSPQHFLSTSMNLLFLYNMHF